MAYVLEKTQRSINFNKSKLPVYVVWIDLEEVCNPIINRIEDEHIDDFTPLAFFTDYGDALDCLSNLTGEQFLGETEDLIEEGFDVNETPLKSDKFGWGEELEEEGYVDSKFEDDDPEVDLVDLFSKQRGR